MPTFQGKASGISEKVEDMLHIFLLYKLLSKISVSGWKSDNLDRLDHDSGTTSLLN